MENHLEKIYSLLKKFDTAMLVTQGRDGLPHARPMGIARAEVNCDVWFFSGRSTEKIREIADDQQVLLVCQNDHARYLSLAGRAQLVTDKTKAAELWKESYRVWFPGGIHDPNLILIRVRVTDAEYWDNSGLQGVKYLFESAKAYVTGQTPNADNPEQHSRAILK